MFTGQLLDPSAESASAATNGLLLLMGSRVFLLKLKIHLFPGDEPEKRVEILNRMFHGGMDMSKPTFIEPPFTVDYVRFP